MAGLTPLEGCLAKGDRLKLHGYDAGGETELRPVAVRDLEVAHDADRHVHGLVSRRQSWAISTSP